MLLPDHDPSPVQVCFSFQKFVIAEVGELGGGCARLAVDLLTQQVVRDGPMVLTRFRLLTDEDAAPLDRVRQPVLLEASIGVLRGGVGEGSDATTKRLAALTAENARLVEDLITVLPVAVSKTARPASGPALPAALLVAARRIADTHRAEHGTPITAAHLGTRMGIALPVATAALAQL